MKKLVGVLALVVVLSVATAPAPRMLGKWFYNERLDPITDENRSFLFAPAIEGPLYTEGALFVRCDASRDAGIEVFFAADTYLGIDDRFVVVYRIDDQEPLTSLWNSSTDSTAVFAPSFDASSLAQGLMEASRLAIRIQGFDGPLTYIVSVDGFRGALDTLGCYTGVY